MRTYGVDSRPMRVGKIRLCLPAVERAEPGTGGPQEPTNYLLRAPANSEARYFGKFIVDRFFVATAVFNTALSAGTIEFAFENATTWISLAALNTAVAALSQADIDDGIRFDARLTSPTNGAMECTLTLTYDA